MVMVSPNHPPIFESQKLATDSACQWIIVIANQRQLTLGQWIFLRTICTTNPAIYVTTDCLCSLNVVVVFGTSA